MNLDSLFQECNGLSDREIQYDSTIWSSFELEGISIPYIFVTGYNDSSNVSNYLSQIYTKGNYNVGYLDLSQGVSLDRIQAKGSPISEEDFLRIYKALKNDTRPNSFSLFLAIALTYFKEKEVSLFILKSNPTFSLSIGKRILSVITDVPMDKGKEHSYFSSISSGITTLIENVEEKRKRLFLREGQKKQSSICFLKEPSSVKYSDPYYRFSYEPYKNLEILSSSVDLLKSSFLAVEAIQLLRSCFPISENDIRNGLLGKPLECKMERFHNVIVDDSHNFEGTISLIESLQNIKNSGDVYVLFASEKKTNVLFSLSLLSRNAQEIILTSFEGDDVRKEEDYSSNYSQFSYQEDWKMALNNLLVYHKNGWILITGSSEFAKQVRHYVKETLKL